MSPIEKKDEELLEYKDSEDDSDDAMSVGQPFGVYPRVSLLNSTACSEEGAAGRCEQNEREPADEERDTNGSVQNDEDDGAAAVSDDDVEEGELPPARHSKGRKRRQPNEESGQQGGAAPGPSNLSQQKEQPTRRHAQHRAGQQAAHNVNRQQPHVVARGRGKTRGNGPASSSGRNRNGRPYNRHQLPAATNAQQHAQHHQQQQQQQQQHLHQAAGGRHNGGGRGRHNSYKWYNPHWNQRGGKRQASSNYTEQPDKRRKISDEQKIVLKHRLENLLQSEFGINPMPLALSIN